MYGLVDAQEPNPLRITATQPKNTRQSHVPSDIPARRRAFRQMHQSGCWAIPNPWDVGSARYLQGLGFKVLATTISGVAWAIGRCDGEPDRQTVLEHLRDRAAATDLPVNADAKTGFTSDPRGVAENVWLPI